MRTRRRLSPPARLVAALGVAAAALGGPALMPVQAASSPATVTMTDGGFTPAAVTIPLGGTVVWQNQGTTAHSATTVGGAPTTFNTPGVGPGQSTSLTFSLPGYYYYTSGADCGVSNSPIFPCDASYLVAVLGPGGVLPAPSGVPAAQVPSSTANNAVVTVTDAGFSAGEVTIVAGGSVTWKNSGNITHTATSLVNTPVPFNTAGIAPGGAATVVFPVPGRYFYTSGIDCISATTPGFPCVVAYRIVVTAANGAPLPAPSAPPIAAPVIIGANGPLPSASIDITDNGFSAGTVNLAPNGTITWNNKGTRVHTATSTPDSNASMPSFDTGGLGANQSASVSFSTPGTYVYLSAPDCLSRSNAGGFNCGYYSVVVGAGQPALATPQPTLPPPVTVPGADVGITIDDKNGFTPAVVTIKPGQTVGWMNVGQNVHSVVVNQKPVADQAPPPWLSFTLPTNTALVFDSGGMPPNQTFTFAFPGVGTFPYHSSTEPIYNTNDKNCGCTSFTFQFFGQVNVVL